MSESVKEDAAQRRSATGVPGLDQILNGGFIPNRLYLIDGNPGSGKTTLSLQYIREGMRLGERVLYVTLSETRDEIEAVAASHGWSLKGLEIVELIADEDNLEADSQVTMYHPSEVELSATTKSILEAVDRLKPARVVIDSLSELRLLAQNSLRYRRQILALKQYFTGRHCTVLLLDDHTSEDSDVQLHSIAHGVITLEQLAPVYGAERRRLRVLKMRGSQYRGGYHDFCIEPGGLRVFPRLIAADHDLPFAPSQIASGVPGLDTLLGGGPHRGTSTLFMGPAGSGKSTVAIQYAVAAAQRGDHAALFSFEESPATLAARTDALGIPFAKAVSDGLLRVAQIDPAELTPGEFAQLVRDAVEQNGARVVVIDSLNGYINAMPEEQFLTLQLHELLSYLSRQGVATMLVVAQHGIMGVSMQTPVDTSYLADSVILFRFFEHAGRVKKAISVVKKRSGSHEESIRELRFARGAGITLSEPLTELHGILTGVPHERSNGRPPQTTEAAAR